MAQFSMEIMRLTGSVLRGNQQDDASGQRETTAVSDLADGRVTDTPLDAHLDLGAHPGEAYG